MLFIYRNAVFAVDIILIIVGMDHLIRMMEVFIFLLFVLMWDDKYNAIASRGEYILPCPW